MIQHSKCSLSPACHNEVMWLATKSQQLTLPANVNKPLCQAPLQWSHNAFAWWCHFQNIMSSEILIVHIKRRQNYRYILIDFCIFDITGWKLNCVVMGDSPTDIPRGVRYDYQIARHFHWCHMNGVKIGLLLGQVKLFLPTPLSRFLYKPVENTMKIRWQLLKIFIRQHILETHGAKI